ncbi:hypothetical protein [Bryobacter aggregatus]|uniref:hypothetical protein n=1 Tax=Bryobacter aggregatus TaxID=360054 RepID=UPI0012BA9559|nr:hypothetical protein [Bryobacter aggregatus]
MATEKQVLANQANAKKSTGPKSNAGKAKSSCNSLGHGLSALPSTLFATNPEAEQSYKTGTLKLRRDCQPDSELEETAFQRYAWATFQAKRARQMESLTQDRWLESPDDAQRFSQMERTQKMAAAYERRAGKALQELRLLQKDRFAAYEVQAEHCAMGRDVPIPKTLPVAQLRTMNLQRTNPNYLAQFLLYQTDEVKDTAKQMLDEAKVNPLASLTPEQLRKLARDIGLST